MVYSCLTRVRNLRNNVRAGGHPGDGGADTVPDHLRGQLFHGRHEPLRVRGDQGRHCHRQEDVRVNDMLLQHLAEQAPVDPGAEPGYIEPGSVGVQLDALGDLADEIVAVDEVRGVLLLRGRGVDVALLLCPWTSLP